MCLVDRDDHLPMVMTWLPQVAAHRPAGRVLWPFVYLAALEHGAVLPDTLLPDERKMCQWSGQACWKVLTDPSSDAMVNRPSATAVSSLHPLASLQAAHGAKTPRGQGTNPGSAPSLPDLWSAHTMSG
jgi:hypothetical protein